MADPLFCCIWLVVLIMLTGDIKVGMERSHQTHLFDLLSFFPIISRGIFTGISCASLYTMLYYRQRVPQNS